MNLRKLAIPLSVGLVVAALATATTVVVRENSAPATRQAASVAQQMGSRQAGDQEVRQSATQAAPSPYWLPAGAQPEAVQAPDMTSKLPAGIQRHVWDLPGAANTDTLTTAGGVDGPDPHPASKLVYLSAPLDYLKRSEVTVRPLSWAITPPNLGPDAKYWKVTPVTINGNQGRSMVLASGFGGVAVMWNDGTRAYALQTHRIQTSDGVSGVSMPDLLRVARSVH